MMVMYILLSMLMISKIRGKTNVSGKSRYNAEVRLEEMMFRGYRNELRPVLEHKDNVTIIVGISLNNIKGMDDKNQILTLSTWLRQKWHDPRLGWDPSNFSSAETIHINAKKLWLPDLKVYNEVNDRPNSGLDQIHTRAVVYASGEIFWMAPYVLKLSCQVNIKYFPYDTQICKVKIGSWTYDGFAVDVKPENYTMDVSKSPSNPQWELVSTHVQRNVQKYRCCPEPYPDVTYTITIKRRVQTYWMNFLFPGIFLTVMTMMAFVSAASDTGERVGLVLTSLVSMFVFLKMVAERTPSSETIPLLSVYFIVLCFEIGLIFYSVCLSIKAYHKNPAMGEMPGFVRNLVLERLGKFWGLRKDGQAITRKLEALRDVALMKERMIAQLEAMKTAGRNSKTPSSTHSRDLCRSIAPCLRKAPEDLAASSQPQNGDPDVLEEGPLLPVAATTAGITHRGNPWSGLSHKDKTSKPQCAMVSDSQKIQEISHPKAAPCTCASHLKKMVMVNSRLLSSIQEIIYVARQYDKTSSEKEHWLLAAAILDRAFLVLFVLMFVIITLVLFLW